MQADIVVDFESVARMNNLPLRMAAGVLAVAALLLCGCPPEEFPNTPAVTLEEINRIRNDADLDPQARRVALAELGLSESTINVLLSTLRTANQFGGTLRSAYDKVTTGRLFALTPDEVQIYADEASAVDDPLNVQLTDRQAQAIVTFFNDFHVTTPGELDALLRQTGFTPPETIPEGVLASVFVDFDPERLLPRF